MNMKKTISLLLGGMMATASLSAFGACTKEDSASTLYVEISNAGFGITWIDPLIEIFEARHPEITVKKSYMTKKDNEMIAKVTSMSTDLDIIFPEDSGSIRHTYEANVDNIFAELTDIYEAKIPGEERTLGDKMNDQFYDYFTTVRDDGTKRHYMTPWMQSPLGIIMNRDVYTDKYKQKYGAFPNTTEEFFAFCDELKNSGVVPMIHSLSDSYWASIWDVWMYQYNGQKEMDSWYKGYCLYGEAKGQRYVPEMFDDEGMYEAMCVWENILKPENGWQHEDCNSLDFTQVQNLFLEDYSDTTTPEIAMMPTGAWLEREMEANFSPDELNNEFVRLPVISALGTKLGITDGVLSDIIDYVDGEATALPSFTSTKGLTNEEVVARVTEARNMNPGYRGYSAFIPAYSNHLALAKEFLQLMASDEGIEAMLKECGSMAAYEYDIVNSPVKDELSDFMYSVNVRAQEGYCFSTKDRLFTNGGLQYFNGIGGSVGAFFAAKNIKDRKTVDEIMDMNYNYVSSMWPTYLSNAGITLG